MDMFYDALQAGILYLRSDIQLEKTGHQILKNAEERTYFIES